MFSISAEPRGGNLAVDLWSAAEATPDRAAVVDRLQATSYAALRARAAAKQVDPEHQKMAELYRQHVLKEQPTLQIQGLGGKKKPVQEVLHDKAKI